MRGQTKAMGSPRNSRLYDRSTERPEERTSLTPVQLQGASKSVCRNGEGGVLLPQTDIRGTGDDQTRRSPLPRGCGGEGGAGGTQDRHGVPYNPQAPDRQEWCCTLVIIPDQSTRHITPRLCSISKTNSRVAAHTRATGNWRSGNPRRISKIRGERHRKARSWPKKRPIKISRTAHRVTNFSARTRSSGLRASGTVGEQVPFHSSRQSRDGNPAPPQRSAQRTGGRIGQKACTCRDQRADDDQGAPCRNLQRDERERAWSLLTGSQ